MSRNHGFAALRVITTLRVLPLFLTLFLNVSAVPLNNADVLKMNSAGLGADVIIASIRGSAEKSFDTGTDALIALKTAKIPDAVISEMLGSKGAIPAAPASGVQFVSNGKAAIGSMLPRPTYTLSGTAFLALPGVPVSQYAWFDGVNSNTVVGADVTITISGTDSTPKIARFQSKKGKRYLTENNSFVIKSDQIVATASIIRNSTGSWTVSFPAGIAAGDYAIVVDLAGYPAAAYDFLVR
jgi:hypothetical protein